MKRWRTFYTEDGRIVFGTDAETAEALDNLRRMYGPNIPKWRRLVECCLRAVYRKRN